MQVDEKLHETDAARSQSFKTVVSEHVTHEITISSHLEAGLVLCCCLVSFNAFVRNRLRASLLISTGFLLVLMKYAIGYFTYPNFQVQNGLVAANMALGPLGLALVAFGLHRQCTQGYKAAQGSAK